MMTDEELMAAAEKAAANAYAPYSGFHVGAAILCRSGAVYTGANMENASYPAGICAESSALSAAVSAGDINIPLISRILRGMPLKSPKSTGSVWNIWIMCRSIRPRCTLRSRGADF